MRTSLLAGMTTRGIAFLTAGIVAAVTGYLLGEKGLLCVGIALTALPLLASVAARRGQYRLSTSRFISPPRVPTGHTATVTLRLENISRAPTGLLLAEDAVPYALGTRPRFVLDKIERRGSRELTYSLRSDLRGKFEIGPLQLRVADSFGLVELTRSASGRTPFVVSPRVFPLSRAVLSRSWAGEGDGRSRLSSTAGEDDVIPREYRDGDELRRVHWRSTARYGELMVRREEQRWRNRATILLDTRSMSHLGTGTASSFEAAVSAAASAGVHVVQEGLTGQFISDGEVIRGGPLFQDVLLDMLAVARPSARRNLDRAFSELRTSSGVIIAIMGLLPAGEARQLAACRTEGSQGLALLLDVASWAEASGGTSASDASSDKAVARATDGSAATSSAAPGGAATAPPASADAAASTAATNGAAAGRGAPPSGAVEISGSADAADHGPAGQPGAARARETAAAEAILRSAGWRVAVLTVSTPLTTAWRQLSVPPTTRLPSPVAAFGEPTPLSAGERAASVSLRIPITAAAAVVLASFSLSAVLAGNGWLAGGIGAVIVVAATGLATRMAGLLSAAVATAAVLIAVVPLLLGHHVPLLVSGIVLVAATAASATGARWLRGFAVCAAYLATLLIFLNLLYASGPSFGHVIPSYDSVVQLGHMIKSAFAEFRYSPPVPDTRAVSLVGAGGIGLVAIMVEILAVRMRRPAVAGLPLLVLFSVPVASTAKTFGALQAVTFALGMTGFLTLLSTAGRERLRMWGRLVTFRYIQPLDEAGAGPDTRDLAASGRRIGLAAVCLAVLVPVVLPVVHAHDVFGTSGTGSGGDAAGGVGGGGFVNAMQGVQRALLEKTPKLILTYTTTAAVPSRQYLQLFVLNYKGSQNAWLPDFNGRLTPQRALGSRLPYNPDGQLASTPTATVTTTVSLTRNQSAAGLEGFLPVPYAPVKLRAEIPGWAELPGSLELYNPGEPAGMSYTVTSQVADPTAAEINSASAQGGIPDSIETQFGSYSGPDIGRLTAIAKQHTVGAATPLQAAADLEAWFQSGSFHYNLNPNLPASSHWLVSFLTSGRRGYCQQFAWAFAVLARLAGIPSRLAQGFTGGTRGPAGTWKVTDADAHVWPELYFAGLGWLWFDPTPHGGRGQGTATEPAYATAPGRGGPKAPAAGASAGARGSAAGGQAASAGALNRLEHGAVGGAGGLAGPSGADLWLAVGLPILALLLISGPGVARRLTRRRRWLTASTDAAAATAAWRELTDDLADYGLTRAPGETPRAVARRLAREASLDQAAARALSRIAGAAERAQYARLAQSGAGLRADGLKVRRALARSVPPRGRIRAWLLPASTLKAAQELLQRAGDMLSWLDASWPTLRRRQRRDELTRTT